MGKAFFSLLPQPELKCIAMSLAVLWAGEYPWSSIVILVLCYIHMEFGVVLLGQPGEGGSSQPCSVVELHPAEVVQWNEHCHCVPQKPNSPLKINKKNCFYPEIQIVPGANKVTIQSLPSWLICSRCEHMCPRSVLTGANHVTYVKPAGLWAEQTHNCSVNPLLVRAGGFLA